MKKVAVLIKDVDQQYEALQTCVGLLLNQIEVQMFVLHHEITDMDQAYQDNMEFMDEIGGRRFSNHPANVEKYGFTAITLSDVARKLQGVDIVIPF